MTWVKKLGPVILILVLIGCVFGPAVFLNFQSKIIVNHIRTEALPESSSGNIGKSNLSVSEKIKIFSGTGASEDIYESYVLMQDSGGYVEEKVKSELKKMIDSEILKGIDPDTINVNDYSCVSYINQRDISQTFSLWMISMDCEDGYLNLTMDAETGMIYEFDIHKFEPDMESEDVGYDIENILSGFRTYLGLTEEEFFDYYDAALAPDTIFLNRY